MGTAIPSGSATGTTSPLNQGMASRSDQKTANDPDKVKQVEKLEIGPAIAVADYTPSTKPPEYTSADYYRYGKFKAGETDVYEIPPLDFAPLDFKNKPASIRVWGKDKKNSKLTDLIPAYTKFILEAVQESRTERSQIIETFGDFYVFCFGERPPVFNFSGQLVNSTYTNWVNDFDFMYETYLRGTKCVERNATALITYGGRQANGLILSMATSTQASVEGAVPVQFSVVVFDRMSFNYSEDLGFFTADNRSLYENESLTKILTTIAGPEGKGMSRPQASKANKGTKDVMEGKAKSSGLRMFKGMGDS